MVRRPLLSPSRRCGFIGSSYGDGKPSRRFGQQRSRLTRYAADADQDPAGEIGPLGEEVLKSPDNVQPP